MTPDQAAMVAFLRQRYAESVEMAHALGAGMIRQAEANKQLSMNVAEAEARRKVHVAEARGQFFEETVVPYLGTAGPTGRIADQQLRLLAWEHAGARDYDEGWRP
ncbi:hypothetical protein GCM10010317_077170 [Streptomyces mirabilis]|uniref:hypothetical protein n=1 Tax=Streptomyces mirabilis TaxID=68239 RepID=UPI00167EDB4F|nr:hypothetical protein [Streptomyces mirabilis]GHD70252.1 hypothetical protein GCM10010317_077170 [Streptomyces mirabilis]